MIKKVQQGFTLIELMIVVAIIGILAAVAIPAYQDYVVKAKLSKVMATIDPVKMATAMYLQENGDLPAAADSWASLGLTAGPTLTTEVTAISQEATTGKLTLTLGNIKAATINGLTVSMAPSTNAGQTAVVWTNTCTVTDPIAIKYFGCP